MRWLTRLLSKQEEGPALLPHEEFPELLEWQKGDEVEFNNYWPDGRALGRYVGIGSDGEVIFQWCGKHFATSVRIAKKASRNRDLQTRRLKAKLGNSEYDEVLSLMQTEIERLRQGLQSS